MPAAERSICFVAPTAWPALSGDRQVRSIGGAEVQQSILGMEFARRGWRSSMVCMDHGQADGQTVGGLDVYRCHAPHEGIPVLRFVHPRATSVIAAMRRADAAIYYQRGASALTGIVAAAACRRRRRFVFAAASDADFDPALPAVPSARDRWLCRWGVRRADLIVVQTERQAEACQRVFGRRPTLVRSAYRGDVVPARHGGSVLFAGTLNQTKRPHLFVELARRLPQWRFVMVGGPRRADDAYARSVVDEARTVSNLDAVGFVPYADVDRYFDAASVFVNTSRFEGFPNTFLQAWSRAVPTVSFFDPIARLDGQPVGVVCADLDRLTAEVAGLMGDAVRWRQAGECCRAYFDRFHSIDRAVDDYTRSFEPLLAA